jgi:hypothetical protein
MSEKRRRLDDGTAVEFFVRDYASVDNELMLFGRDSTGGSVCVRVPYERTLYLLPRAVDPVPPTTPFVPGLVRTEMRELEFAFPQQRSALAAPGRRNWLVVTHRSRSAHAFDSSSPFEASAWSSSPGEAFFVERGIKCSRWLAARDAQLVPRDQQLTHCLAEYTASDIAEVAASDVPPPAIIVLRVDPDSNVALIESIDCGNDGKCTVLEREGDAGHSAAQLVELYDPDVVHGNIELHAKRAPVVRFRDRAGRRVQRMHPDADDGDVWQASLVARVCGCPLRAARPISSACQFLLLHAMHKRGFVPVLPERGSMPFEVVKGGNNLDTVGGVYRGDTRVLHFDFRSLYPSLVLEYNIDLSDDLEQPLLPALMSGLIDARRCTPAAAFGAAFKKCANALIGCFGSRNLRLYCPSAYARITGKGRETLNRAVALVRREKLGTVIAGQTDSLLVACSGDSYAAIAERLCFLVNGAHQHVHLAVSNTWSSVYMSSKKNRYAALDDRALLTTNGLLDKTQTAATQGAIRAACKQLLGGAVFTPDEATLALPVEQRTVVLRAISELCSMAAAMEENDVRRKLQLNVRALQRVSSLQRAPLKRSFSSGDQALRPNVAGSDATPPPVVPIEDLFAHHAPLCVAASAAVIADARDDSLAPAAYPHLQHMYLALRSFGLSHGASRDAIVGIGPIGKQVKRAAKVNGMEEWPYKVLQDEVERRNGDERAASCLWVCAASVRCPYKQGGNASARRTLLAQRGVDDGPIEQLVAQGKYELACATEFAARHNGRTLVANGQLHPAHYVQQSFN